MVQTDQLAGHMCCGCFPIKCGLVTLGIFDWIGCVGWAIICLAAGSNSLTSELLTFVVPVFIFHIIAVIFWTMWFCNDNEGTRNRLYLTQVMSILAELSNLISALVYGNGTIEFHMTIGGGYGKPAIDPTLAAILAFIISCLLHGYWLWVCKRYEQIFKNTFA